MAKVAKNKQMAVLNYIHKQVEDHGYPPTVREICSAVGLSSTSTVHGHISRLIEQGFLQKDPSKPRALEITSKGLDILGVKPIQKEIPMLGVVTAGQPILAVENATEFFPIPPSIQDNNDLFMLTIRGTSMIKAGIFNGDQVIVRKQSTANNGDIVVALIDGEETTVKRYFRELRSVRLQPENDKYQPIVGSDNIQVLGKVISVFRML